MWRGLSPGGARGDSIRPKGRVIQSGESSLLLSPPPRACPLPEDPVNPRTRVMGLGFPQTQHYFLLCFLLKFSLTISSCLICFAFTLQSFCDRSRARNLTNCSSIMLPRWVPP